MQMQGTSMLKHWHAPYSRVARSTTEDRDRSKMLRSTKHEDQPTTTTVCQSADRKNQRQTTADSQTRR